MNKKGRLHAGMDADVVVFDVATIQDRATYADPAQPSVGMQYVLVNGVPVIADGELVRDARSGKPVRRSVPSGVPIEGDQSKVDVVGD